MSKGKAKPQVTKTEIDPASMARIGEYQDTVKNWALPYINGEKSLVAGGNEFLTAAGNMIKNQAENPMRTGGGQLGGKGGPARYSGPMPGGGRTHDITGMPLRQIPSEGDGQPSLAEQFGNARKQAMMRGEQPAMGSNPIFGNLPQFQQLTAGDGVKIQAPTQVAAAQGDMSKFMNPYMKDVVDTSLADFDAGTDRSRNAMNMRQAASGAFGGGRHGIAAGTFEADAARGRGSLGAGIRSQGFTQAAQLADAEANRTQQANIANAQMQMQSALAQAQLDAERSRTQDSMNQLGALQNFGLARDVAMATPGAQLARDQFGLNSELGRGQLNLQSELGRGGLALDQARFNQGVSQQGIDNLFNFGNAQRNIENQQLQGALPALDYYLRAGAMTPQNSIQTTTGPGAGKGGFLGGLGSLGNGLGAMKAAGFFSHSKFKTDIAPADGFLEGLKRLTIARWRYRDEVPFADGHTHIGPMAEQFREIFGVGDGITLNPIDVMGVAIGALKELAERRA